MLSLKMSATSSKLLITKHEPDVHIGGISNDEVKIVGLEQEATINSPPKGKK
jgi:hypothetical protein